MDIALAPVNEIYPVLVEGGLNSYDYCGPHGNAGGAGRTRRNAWDTTRRNARRSAVSNSRIFTGNGEAYPKICNP